MGNVLSVLLRRAKDAPSAVFTPPNPDALYDKFEMGHAAAAGAFKPGNAPGPHDLAPVETKAAGWVTALATAAAEKVRTELAAAEVRCGDIASHAEADFTNAEAHASIEEQRAKADMRAKLVAAEAELHIAEVQKQLFKDNNRLINEPREPESLRCYLLLTTSMIGLEAAANITAFAPTMEHGYAQALLTAIIYAGVNVGFSILFAAWIREVFVTTRWRKAIGWFGIGAYAFALAEWVQLLGDYRAALASGSEQPGADAARALLQLPTESVLTSIEAIVLMAVTTAFSIIAVVATLGLRDKVPGYHAAAKHVRRAKAALEAAKRQYRGRLRTVVDRMRDDVDRERKRAVAARQALRGEIGQMKSMIARYQGFSMALPGVLVPMSERYRQQMARLGGFEVASYQGEWPLPLPVDLEGVKQKIADFERRLNALTVAGALERDAADAHAAILAIEKQMLDTTESFFEECGGAAHNNPGRASSASFATRRNLPLSVSRAVVSTPGD